MDNSKRSLASIRREKGLSQAKLARLLGISPAAIALYETGKRTPRLATARKIARVLSVSLDDLEFCCACKQQAQQGVSENG